jgi:hypothetical protein
MSRRRKALFWSVTGAALYLVAESLLPAPWQPTARASLALIEGYQSVGSPAMKAGGVRCRYTPTCSHFAHDAIGHYGMLGGAARTAGRLWRCSPWGGCGYDPAVPLPEISPAQETEAERKKREEEMRKAEEDFKKGLQEAGKAIREGFKEGGPEAAGAAACCLFQTVFCIVGPLVWVAAGVILLIWVYKDAKARGDQNAVIWIVVMLLAGPVGALVWLLARPKGNIVPCAGCKNGKLEALAKCPHCGNETASGQAGPGTGPAAGENK